MKKLKEVFGHPAFVISLFLSGLLLLTLPFYSPGELSNFSLFLGRLHPLVLHFPIVLIILTMLFEVGRYFKILKVTDTLVMIVLLSAAASALFSVAAGFFLFASGDYSGNLMEQHFWGGVTTGFFIFTTAGLFVVYTNNSKYYFPYLSALLISNLSVAYTSHLGGSITHGHGYLTEHLQLMFNTDDTYKTKPEAEMLVYEDLISPIFESKCISCHNTQKAKGNFLMTTYENLLKPGESNTPSITPQRPDKSELFNRVILPEEHKDHMPPEGKTPLTQNEIALLKFWIEAGAKKELYVREAKKDKNMSTVIEKLLPDLSRYRRKVQIENIKQKTLENELKEIANTLSIRIQKDSTGEDAYFTIAMSFPPAPFTNDQFKILHPYAAVFSKASLVSSGIDDAGLYYIGQMINLEKLFLQKTNIDGSGLVYLQHLPKLKVLNLSFTKVDDKAALDLLKIHNLEEVYLYRTGTSKEVVDAIQKNKPSLKIFLQEGPYF